MKKIGKIGISLFLLSLLFLTACSTQLNVGVEGQINENDSSGTIDLDIDLGNEDQNSSDQSNSQNSGSTQEPIALQSTGLLILLGLGMLVMIGLLIGLLRTKGAK